MMGSPCYYDVLFDPFDVVLHDCMWSGTCCIQLVQQQQQPQAPPAPQYTAEQQQQQQQQHHEQHQALFALTSGPATATVGTVSAAGTPSGSSVDGGSSSSSGDSPEHQTAIIRSQLNLNETKVVRTEATASRGHQPNASEKRVKVRLLGPRKVPSKLHQFKPQAQQQQQQQPLTRSQLQASLVEKQHNQHHQRNQQLEQAQPGAQGRAPARAAAAADNKKLRHREVEKNRHRQLQAMVKTLSDRIPGKIEKETQVQTMKRAAKYCLYLHDVLTHGQLGLGKDKLERLYLRSCQNVDLMMANDDDNDDDDDDDGGDEHDGDVGSARNRHHNHNHNHSRNRDHDRGHDRDQDDGRLARPKALAGQQARATDSATAKLID